MPSVNLILPAGEAVVTGKQITFSSPCSNDGLNSILINGIEYALVDACRKPIGDVPEVFVRGALVSVVIDESNKLAYVQNAANNRYGIPIKQSIFDGVATLALNTKYRVYAEVKHEVEADYFDCTVQLGCNLKSVVCIATLPSIEVTDTHREYFDIKILSVSRNTGDSTEDTVIYEIDGVRNQYSYPVVVLSMPVPTALLVKGATSVYSCPENMTGGTFVTPDEDATPGEDGGYYVPAVTDNEDGTVTFTFSASKDEMATIDPITIELPKGVAGAHVTSVEEYWGDATHTTYRMTFSNDTHYDFDVYHGHDGADGGHYTPSIKDNDNGTMTVSFSASKEGMPDINPVTVTIPKGKDGKSAYEIYLDNGGFLTESAWLESLEGKDGKSAYDIAVDNGFVGDETDFMVALKGKDGGHYSPSIHTITENSFKISFTPRGSDMPVIEDVTITLPTAEDGVGIESIVQTTTSKEDGGENVITITLTNGNKSTFKIKNGSKGGKGDAGKGISKVEKTSTSGLSDTYTITYTDGSTSTYTVMNGDKGDAGIGIKSILQTTTSSADGGENVVTVILTDDTQSTFKFKNGSKGNAGNGIKSIAKTSTSGLVDTYTITFTDNTTATFTVTNGKAGTSVTISSVTESTESGGSNVVEFSDGKSITIKNGKDGKDYILTDDDKTEIIQEILAELGAAVIGYIDGNTITVKGNLAEGVYTAYYEVDGKLVEIGELSHGVEPVTYTITWKNDDGSVLKTDTVKEGTKPLYSGATPTKASDGQYNYTFKAWSPTIVAATADATYTATYNKTAIEVETYRVTFVADGTTVATVTYEKGATSVEEPAVPEKTGYTGAWKPYTLNNTNITVEAEYTAKTYTITWNVDGTETTETYKYGDEPSFKGSTAKAADTQYTYTFNGWSPSITTVTGDKTYTAQYTQTEIAPVKPKNFAGTLTAGRLSNSGAGNISHDTPAHRVTGYVPVEKEDTVYVTGFLHCNSTTGGGGVRFMAFDGDKKRLESVTQTNNFSSAHATLKSKTDTSVEFTITSTTVVYVRFSDTPADSEDKITVNIKRKGEWVTK